MPHHRGLLGAWPGAVRRRSRCRRAHRQCRWKGHLDALACDFDGHRLAVTLRPRRPRWRRTRESCCRTRFRSIGVNVEVFLGSNGAKAGSLTTTRWKVIAVAMPSTSNSASARRERSSASWRVAPVTISFASRESKFPPITSPVVKPPSSRTPGPDGGFHTVSTPGAGRKLRPGSSPLIRNSNEWPRRIGSS